MYVEGPHVCPCNSSLGRGTGGQGERPCRRMDRMAYFSFWPMFLRRMCKAFFASQRVVTFDLLINNFIVINALINARYRKLPLMTLAFAVDELCCFE